MEHLGLKQTATQKNHGFGCFKFSNCLQKKTFFLCQKSTFDWFFCDFWHARERRRNKKFAEIRTFFCFRICWKHPKKVLFSCFFGLVYQMRKIQKIEKNAFFHVFLSMILSRIFVIYGFFCIFSRKTVAIVYS